MGSYVLALDQGTTSSRSILFSRDGRLVAAAQKEFRQILPQPGLVEHDPEDIWSSQLETARQVIGQAGVGLDEIAAVGIANQRETVVLWERDTGRAVHNAIVWQSRASAPVCERLKREGAEPMIRQRTGLLLDPYFTASKVTYLFEKEPALRERAERGELLLGTVDSWLVWRLTGGKRHVTDLSNASRTLLLNIHTRRWDDELLELFGIPRAMLPEVVPSSGVVDRIDRQWLGSELPLAGIVGDQQGATFGQACFEPGEAKCTYGTGAFLLVNTGTQPVASEVGLLTTIGWGIGDQVVYCLEGSVFVSGAIVQWLRDGLKMFDRSEEVEALAAQVDGTDGVYLVPALVGLGAPYWDPYARGVLIGLTRGTTQAHVARAALESMAYSIRDLMEVMQKEMRQPLQLLKVDGGAAANNLLMQFQADILGLPVERPVVAETTALGAAYLAGLAVQLWSGLDDIRRNGALDRTFVPEMNPPERDQLYQGWQRAVKRSLGWAEGAS